MIDDLERRGGGFLRQNPSSKTTTMGVCIDLEEKISSPASLALLAPRILSHSLACAHKKDIVRIWTELIDQKQVKLSHLHSKTAVFSGKNNWTRATRHGKYGLSIALSHLKRTEI